MHRDTQPLNPQNQRTLGSGPKNYQWYQSLNKPSLTPPQIVFPIVWTILYIMMGVSFFLYLKATQFQYSTGLLFFCIQLLLNIIWTPLFFWRKMIAVALVDIILMQVFIILTIIWFHRDCPVSAYLLIPYSVWVFLATYLNAYIVRHNKDPTCHK